MRPAAHSLSLPPPKKASKERRPHVSGLALRSAPLRSIPGKPARARACVPPGHKRQKQWFGMGCKALSRSKAEALQGCASRKTAPSAFLQPRTGGVGSLSGGAAELALRSAIAPLGQLPLARNTMQAHAALQWLRRRHRHRRRCLKGWASRTIAALGPGRASLALACRKAQVHGLALRGETVGVRGAVLRMRPAASVQQRECERCVACSRTVD